MPSVIIVNGGPTLNSLLELNVINVKNHDTSVILLSNLDKVSDIQAVLLVVEPFEIFQGVDIGISGIQSAGFSRNFFVSRIS